MSFKPGSQKTLSTVGGTPVPKVGMPLGFVEGLGSMGRGFLLLLLLVSARRRGSSFHKVSSG